MERLRKKVFRKKEELHGKAIAFTVYEEDRWSEELGNWNWLKTGLLKKETGNANGCTRPSFENKQHKGKC